MEYDKKELQVYRQGRVITDQFYIDDDYNVPDARSDVKRIILGEGSLAIEDMKVVENYIRISGKMNFKVLYVSEEGQMRLSSLEGRIPFEEMVYLEEQPKENIFIRASNADVTVTMIHSRKLNVKALVELELCSHGKESMTLTSDAENSTQLYKKFVNETLLRLYTVKKDTYRIKEEVSVDGTKENIGTLLWTDVMSRKLDTRVGTDEILLQGELLLFCFYESVEGKTDWMERTIPYEGKIECYGVTDSMFHQIYPELSDVNIDIRMDEDGEMRILGIEATLEVRVVVYEEEELRLLEDVYALDQNCMPKMKEKHAERLLMQNHSKCKVSERLSLPEIKDDILQICHSSARIQMEHMEVVPEGIRLEGVLHAAFLYVKSDDNIPFDVWQGMVPFTYLMESNETTPDMTCDLTCSVEQLAVGLLGNDEVEVKAVLAFNSFLKAPVSVMDMEEIEFSPLDMEEMQRRPGITGYIVKEGDELWNLAKRFSTTAEGIREVNHLENQDIRPGDKILIFKENMSIL